MPARLLASSSGYVIADASSVYHELYRNESGIVEVGCWAHARRRFFDALSVDRERALVGIGFIPLYDSHEGGAPVFASHTGYGIHHAGDSADCSCGVAYYQSLKSAETKLNVRTLTASP